MICCIENGGCFHSPFHIPLFFIMVLLVFIDLLGNLIATSKLLTRKEHQSIPAKPKTLSNNLIDVLHVLVDGQIVLRVAMLLLTPFVVRRICQYETYRTFKRFAGLFIRVHGFPDVCVTIENDFTHFGFEHLISFFHFIVKSRKSRYSAPAGSQSIISSTKTFSLTSFVPLETALVDK